MVNIPATKDIIQIKKKLKKPEIRVWHHPHFISKDGEDYYYVFDSFAEAFAHIKKSKDSEDVPLIAIGGYELNIFEIEEEE